MPSAHKSRLGRRHVLALAGGAALAAGSPPARRKRRDRAADLDRLSRAGALVSGGQRRFRQGQSRRHRQRAQHHVARARAEAERRHADRHRPRPVRRRHQHHLHLRGCRADRAEHPGGRCLSAQELDPAGRRSFHDGRQELRPAAALLQRRAVLEPRLFQGRGPRRATRNLCRHDGRRAQAGEDRQHGKDDPQRHEPAAFRPGQRHLREIPASSSSRPAARSSPARLRASTTRTTTTRPAATRCNTTSTRSRNTASTTRRCSTTPTPSSPATPRCCSASPG